MDLNKIREAKSNKKIFDKFAPRVYIYGLLDDDGNIVYVGKSINVEQRLQDHKRNAVIIDYYQDLEVFYINYLQDSGYLLENLEKIRNTKTYEIDEIVYLKKSARKKHVYSEAIEAARRDVYSDRERKRREKERSMRFENAIE
tara:strand:+ start:93 stop:521 length:429 start_codon:yes stop_codon:yes gene_type:complete